jgi:RecA-family ATPase
MGDMLSLPDFLNWKAPPVTHIIGKGVLVKETSLVVYGLEKSWKSMLGMYTAVALAAGRPWLGFPTTKCVVLLFQLEIPDALMQDRLKKFIANCDTCPPNLFHWHESFCKLTSGFGLAALDKRLVQIKTQYPDLPIVFILDPMYKVVEGNISDQVDMQKLIDNVDLLKARHNVTNIIIHHERKKAFSSDGQRIDSGSDSMYGASNLKWWLDNGIKCECLNMEGAQDTVKLDFSLIRHAVEPIDHMVLKWNRKTLQPQIIKVIKREDSNAEPDEPLSVR